MLSQSFMIQEPTTRDSSHLLMSRMQGLAPPEPSTAVTVIGIMPAL